VSRGDLRNRQELPELLAHDSLQLEHRKINFIISQF
jgi:hypothetical protein